VKKIDGEEVKAAIAEKKEGEKPISSRLGERREIKKKGQWGTLTQCVRERSESAGWTANEDE